MRIYLVRHGQSLANVDWDVNRRIADHAIELSKLGKRQAIASGQKLDAHLTKQDIGLGGVRVWTSPYRRTRDTANAVVESLGRNRIRDVREHTLLCEQQFGLFDGLSDKERAELYPAEHAHYERCEQFEGHFWARMPLGESRFDVAARVHQSFGTFHRDFQRHGIDNIVVVCHGVTLRAFVMMWLHHSPEWFDAEPNPGNGAIRLIEDNEDRGYIFSGFDHKGLEISG